MTNLVKVYLGPYKKRVALIFILLVIEVFLQIVIINLIKPIVSDVIGDADTDEILLYGSIMLALIALYSLITFVVSRMAAQISAESVSKLRDDMFKKIVSFKRPRDSGASMSGLTNRLITDVNNIQDFISEFLCMGMYVPLLFLGVIIATVPTYPFLSLTLMLAFFVALFVMFHLGRGQLQVRAKMQRMFDRILHMFREMVVGARTSRAFDNETERFDSFSSYNKDYSTLVTGTAVKISKMTSIATLTLVLVIVLLYPFLIVNFSDLLVDRSELIIFIQYLVLFISCAGLSSFIYTTIPQMRSSYGRISKVMRGESEPDGMPVPDSFEGPIVSCSNGLVIPVGRETSLVGTSGSGKSETIRCLLRLDDVESGDFTFKGADITELDPRGLRSSIAYAGNLAPAFRGTVRDNVRVWRDISDERLNEAMEAAELKLDPDMFLEKFGSNISMGQIQKISIARALAAEADLYIFDDCFTELDPKTENEIVSNIRKMLEGRTVLFVSHKLRISSGSDGIAVMEDGKVIDTGTHEALVERCTVYRDMYIAGGGIVG